MDDARIRPQLVRDIQARMAGCEQYVPENALAIQREPAAGGAHALDARLVEASLPAAPFAQLRDVREKVLDARVVAIEH